MLKKMENDEIERWNNENGRLEMKREKRGGEGRNGGN